MERKRKEAIKRFNIDPSRTPRGDIWIRGYRSSQKRCIVEVQLSDTDQKIWVSRKVEEFLAKQELNNKKIPLRIH